MAKNLSSKEVHEFREMLRITGSKKSRFNDEMKLDTVVENMVGHIIDKHVLSPPHIACVTVYQIMRGGGRYWKNTNPVMSSGLLSHAGISQPPNWYLAEQGRRFGYIMDWPPLAIRNIITSSMRKNYINPVLDGDVDDCGYQIGWCQGYINEENGQAKYVPEYGKAISCYFIMATDANLRQEIERHIVSCPMWFRKQWLMMLEKLPKMISGYQRMGDRVHHRMEVLGRQWQIDQSSGTSLLLKDLNPQVPEDRIDWRDVDENAEDDA